MLSRRALLAAAVAVPIGGALRARPSSGRFVSMSLPPLGLTGSYKEAAALRDAGASFLEINSNDLLPNETDEIFKDRRKALLECGLPILGSNSFMPGSLRSTGPDANHAGVAKRAEVIFRRAAEVGMRVVTFGSSGSRSLPKDYPTADGELQFVALLARLAPLAAKYGIILCVEPLQKSETNFIRYVSEAKRLVAAVQHDNVAITADVFHMLRGAEPPQAIRDAAPYIRHVHIAEKEKRTAPGVAGDDFSAYLQALKDIKYTGHISMECGWESRVKQLPKAIETMREQWGSLN